MSERTHTWVVVVGGLVLMALLFLASNAVAGYLPVPLDVYHEEGAALQSNSFWSSGWAVSRKASGAIST